MHMWSAQLNTTWYVAAQLENKYNNTTGQICRLIVKVLLDLGGLNVSVGGSVNAKGQWFEVIQMRV